MYTQSLVVTALNCIVKMLRYPGGDQECVEPLGGPGAGLRTVGSGPIRSRKAPAALSTEPHGI